MRRISLALTGILLTTYINAQEVKKLSMKDCMEYAIMHNYTVKNARVDVQIQKAQNNQTLSASYPHINGKVELTDFLNPQKTFIEARTFEPTAPAGLIVGFPFALNYSGNASISASQLLFDGAVFIALKARNSVMELARNRGNMTEETVRYNVYKAYSSLVIAYRQFDIVKGTLGFSRAILHDMEAMRQTGFVEKIAVDQMTVQINNFATDSMRIANMLIVSEQLLKYNMGMDIDIPIALTDTALADREKGMMTLVSEQQDYEKIPMYNVARTALKLNQYNLKRYQLTAWPSLAIIGSTGYNYATNKFVDIVTPRNYAFYSLVGLQLNVPIFNGMLRTNQVREAKLNIEKSQNDIEYTKQSIDFQVKVSRTTLKNAMLQAQSQKRNMELAGTVLDLAQRKYKEGVGSNTEVTQAQTELSRAQSNYFSALLDEINAEADLKKALGMMTSNNLN